MFNVPIGTNVNSLPISSAQFENFQTIRPKPKIRRTMSADDGDIDGGTLPGATVTACGLPHDVLLFKNKLENSGIISDGFDGNDFPRLNFDRKAVADILKSPINSIQLTPCQLDVIESFVTYYSDWEKGLTNTSDCEYYNSIFAAHLQRYMTCTSPQPLFSTLHGREIDSHALLGGDPIPVDHTDILSTEDIKDASIVDDGRPNITDITKYTQCFNDGNPGTYTLTLYVDQPVVGSNESFHLVVPLPTVETTTSTLPTNNSPLPHTSPSAPITIPTGIHIKTTKGEFNVGHAFVGFIKTEAGQTIRQTLGFYPTTPVAALVPNGYKGAIKDDSGHPFNVSYSITVSKEQFDNAITSVEKDFTSATYTLTNLKASVSPEYNCTEAAVNWMNSAGGAFKANGANSPFQCTPGSLGQNVAVMPGANTVANNASAGHGSY